MGAWPDHQRSWGRRERRRSSFHPCISSCCDPPVLQVFLQPPQINSRPQQSTASRAHNSHITQPGEHPPPPPYYSSTLLYLPFTAGCVGNPWKLVFRFHKLREDFKQLAAGVPSLPIAQFSSRSRYGATLRAILLASSPKNLALSPCSPGVVSPRPCSRNTSLASSLLLPLTRHPTPAEAGNDQRRFGKHEHQGESGPPPRAARALCPAARHVSSIHVCRTSYLASVTLSQRPGRTDYECVLCGRRWRLALRLPLTCMHHVFRHPDGTPRSDTL